jgi:hypothetical protein
MQQKTKVKLNSFAYILTWRVLIYNCHIVGRDIATCIKILVALGHHSENDILEIWVVAKHMNRCLECSLHWWNEYPWKIYFKKFIRINFRLIYSNGVKARVDIVTISTKLVVLGGVVSTKIFLADKSLLIILWESVSDQKYVGFLCFYFWC